MNKLIKKYLQLKWHTHAIDNYKMGQNTLLGNVWRINTLSPDTALETKQKKN